MFSNLPDPITLLFQVIFTNAKIIFIDQNMLNMSGEVISNQFEFGVSVVHFEKVQRKRENYRNIVKTKNGSKNAK